MGQPGPVPATGLQQPVPPLTPYGTSWPSAGAGSLPGSAPDPFAPMGRTPSAGSRAHASAVTAGAGDELGDEELPGDIPADDRVHGDAGISPCGR